MFIYDWSFMFLHFTRKSNTGQQDRLLQFLISSLKERRKDNGKRAFTYLKTLPTGRSIIFSESYSTLYSFSKEFHYFNRIKYTLLPCFLVLDNFLILKSPVSPTLCEVLLLFQYHDFVIYWAIGLLRWYIPFHICSYYSYGLLIYCMTDIHKYFYPLVLFWFM